MDFPENFPHLWVGLGNPGGAYTHTRHNIGYRVVDFLAGKFITTGKKKLKTGELWEVRARQVKITLFKPALYMNRSGEAVSRLLGGKGGSGDSMVVVHDDLDLEFGRIKIKWKGGDAGHKGIRSLMDRLQTSSFFRIKIGVGRPPEGVDPADYVLTPFNREEEAALGDVLEKIGEGVDLWLAAGGLSRSWPPVRAFRCR
ncbi:MAG: aminoacyl-tRNA hydrolase [Nitrospiraceae bacterium]|nr:aminoacyl-tRNA hydrolase [Nitrospiraceae bacterium]